MNRRRPVGIGALQKDKERMALFRSKGTSLAKEELDKLTNQMNEFKTNLERFAQKHKSDIKKNPEFRRQFQQMCATAGVDPLQSSGNFWVKLLGIGDFYYELAVQIAEIFLATSHKNGGIFTLEELKEKVSASRKNSESITTNDILQAIKKLRVFGSIKEIPSRDSYLIQAAEMNSDQLEITQVAHSNHGCVSHSLLSQSLKWSSERIQRALDDFVMEGLVWVDDQEEKLYWFPGLLS